MPLIDPHSVCTFEQVGVTASSRDRSTWSPRPVRRARRNAAVAAQGPEAAGAAEGQLNGALRQLFALTEAYPDLKANQGFLQLQSELSNLETKIAAARRFFNNAVAEFNTAIEQFPAVLLAGMFGFRPRAFFEVKEEERAAIEAAPAVKF